MYDHLTEPRTSPNIAAGSTELTEYDIATIEGRYSYQPSRFRLRLDSRFRHFDYDDNDTLTGTVDNSDRDRDMLNLGARFGFDVADNYGLFLEGRLLDVEYDQTFDNAGFERSYDGYEVNVGTELMLTGLITGEFFLGYMSRDFDDERFEDVDGLSYGAGIDWLITKLMTLNLDGSRSTDPTTVVGASTILNSQVSVGVDYELLRQLILQAKYTFEKDDFEDIAREDDNNIFTLGAKYRMNRNLMWSAQYRYWDRDISPSGAGGRQFTINEFRIGLICQI
jgi:hypothetical protein